MNDTSLYQQILGPTDPWYVSGVRLIASDKTIEVEMSLKDNELWGCPECARRMHRHSVVRRRRRHLDSCQFKTYVVADVPRVLCPEHGSVTVAVPWS